MTPPGHDGVAALLANPGSAATLPAAAWTPVIQQARSAGLLARLAEALESACPTRPWPAGVSEHFASAARLCRAQQAEIEREVNYLVRALAPLGLPLVLLKGAAYAMARLPSATGRVFGDIDILVPKAAIARVESQLVMHGWVSTHHDAYDQRYYRQWMHELPPMQHVHRGTVLDVHHTILPETARLRPDPRLLFESAAPVPGQPGVQVLGPEDMVLHSMTHLFLNDDMHHALRDLSDLDLLLRHFGGRAGYWDRLQRRAETQQLTRPLHYGLRHAARLLATPIPPAAQRAASRFGPPPGVAQLMDAIWARALHPQHASALVTGADAALFALYLRGHWLRMPLPLLARHLAIKAWMRLDKPAGKLPGPAP